MSAANPLVLLGPAWPYRGGIAHFNESLAAKLRARGHRVELVTFSRQYPERFFPGETQFEAGADHAAEGEAQRLVDAVNPLSWLAAGRHIRRLEADAVVAQLWMPFLAPALGTVLRAATWRRPTRTLGVVHNALPHERLPADVLLNRYAYAALDGAIVMSDAVRRGLAELAPRLPIEQVEHPVYDHFGEALPRAEARRRLDLPDDAPLLLFFGFVRRYKGLDVLLDALPHVLAKRPDARLVVAGEFLDDAQPYHERIERLGLADAVLLHDRYIASENVGTFFCASDVVVQPYRHATQSGVAQIAFHFGRPLVTTDVGGLAEAVPDGEAGFVVPPEDPPALADALLRALDEKDRLAEGARHQQARFSWDRVGEAVERLAA